MRCLFARADAALLPSDGDEEEDEPKIRENGFEAEADLKRCSYVDCRGEDALVLLEVLVVAANIFCVFVSR